MHAGAFSSAMYILGCDVSRLTPHEVISLLINHALQHHISFLLISSHDFLEARLIKCRISPFPRVPWRLYQFPLQVQRR